MVCAQYGRYSIMEYLIAHGANIHQQDVEGHTAIQIAYLFGHNDCVNLLIESGADASSVQGFEFGHLKTKVDRLI